MFNRLVTFHWGWIIFDIQGCKRERLAGDDLLLPLSIKICSARTQEWEAFSPDRVLLTQPEPWINLGVNKKRAPLG